MHDTKHSIYDCIIYMEYDLMFYACHCMCIQAGGSPCRKNFLLGIAHPLVGPPFKYERYKRKRRSFEAVSTKKAELWP